VIIVRNHPAGNLTVPIWSDLPTEVKPVSTLNRNAPPPRFGQRGVGLVPPEAGIVPDLAGDCRRVPVDPADQQAAFPKHVDVVALLLGQMAVARVHGLIPSSSFYVWNNRRPARPQIGFPGLRTGPDGCCDSEWKGRKNEQEMQSGHPYLHESRHAEP